ISPLLHPVRFGPWGPGAFASTQGVRWSYAPRRHLEERHVREVVTLDELLHFVGAEDPPGKLRDAKYPGVCSHEEPLPRFAFLPRPTVTPSSGILILARI